MTAVDGYVVSTVINPLQRDLPEKKNYQLLAENNGNEV